MGFRPAGFKKPRIVSKVRRTKAQAYGTPMTWTQLSAACLKRDGNRCTRCGCASAPGNKLEAHHIISIAMGGRNHLLNLRTLCERCHSKMPHHGHLRHKHK